MVHDVIFMSLPLLLLLAYGLARGLRQLCHTRRTLQPMLAQCVPALPLELLQQAHALGIASQVDLVASDRAEAFCYGLLHPRICITTQLVQTLTPCEVEAVLRHERHHLRRRDPLRAWLWTVTGSGCWWLRDQAKQADVRRELAADRAVIAAQGRMPLASALFKLMASRAAAPPADLAISGMSATDARIEQLLDPHQPIAVPPSLHADHALLVSVLLFSLIAVCSAVMTYL
jgi:Zn-dependent protease with chaperone function